MRIPCTPVPYVNVFSEAGKGAAAAGAAAAGDDDIPELVGNFEDASKK
jgi:hypothetical protein